MDSHDPLAETHSSTRTAVACTPCRHSKLKCDGSKPICRTCDRKSRNCVYDAEKTKYHSLLEQFQQAQDRIKEVEQSREALREVLHGLTFDLGIKKKDLRQHEKLFEASQDWPGTGTSVLGTSVILPAGWIELCRIFRVHYASDLSFIHLPTLIDPYIAAAYQRSNDHDEGNALDTTKAPLPDSSGLIFAFLALTLRHCRSKVREYLVPRARDMNDATVLSAYFAALAKRSLASDDTDLSCPEVEGVQVRQMLATYDWSMGRSQQAKQLLSDATSIAGDIGLLQNYRAKRGCSSISVAMAFEAESMGIQMRYRSGYDVSPDHGVKAEAVRRTAWSLFLLDTAYALGDHRSKLICNTDNFPPLPGSEAMFVEDVSITAVQDNERLSGWQKQQVPPMIDSQLCSDSNYSTSASTGSWPTLTPTISTTSSNSPPEEADDKILCFYIRYVSLFHHIHLWAHSKPWSTEKNPPWSKLCSWNALLRRLLTINKSLPARARLTKSNTFDHARNRTAAQYFNMHIARLLCQMALHWECMPFLPLRYTQAEGPQRLRSLFRHSTEAPPGFWKSSARAFFGGAQSVLDLAADARVYTYKRLLGSNPIETKASSPTFSSDTHREGASQFPSTSIFAIAYIILISGNEMSTSGIARRVQRRKVKCSTEPQCSNCTRDGKTCIYSSPIYRVSALTRNLDRHETFIENVKRAWAVHVPNISLEQALSDLEQHDQDAPPQAAASSTPGDPSWSVQGSSALPEDPDSGNAEYSNAEDFEFDESEDFNEAIDGMGFLTVGPRKSGYTGPQSGIAAMRFLQSLPTEGHLEYEEPVPGVSPSDSTSSHEPALSAVNIDEMVNDFFTLFHPAYPLLHEGLFRARMAGVAPKPRDGSWQLLFNMVVTMGAFVGDSENTSLDLGFYRRARESVSLSVLGKGSLCYVQALVLMGNYLQKRNKPNAGFACIGIAWSMALAIGLHREFGTFSTSPFTMELRRRTWWVLFIFVSGAQLTFGRPPASLIGVNTRLPTNLEDSNMVVDMEILPEARHGPTVTSCLIAQIQLATIANAVQTGLLSNKVPDHTNAHNLDGQITAWLNGLPAYIHPNSQLPPRLELPKQVLLWRSYHLRIVLHRPFLFHALAKNARFSTGDHGVQTCIGTADTCVDSIHAFLAANPRSKRGFAWYATYWLLSACFVHATSLAYRPTDPAAVHWKYRLERALEALQVLAPAQGVAVRAQKLLANLVDRYNHLQASAASGEPWPPGEAPDMAGFPTMDTSLDLPIYHNFNLDDNALPMEGSAADLLWLWPQDVNAEFLNPETDFM